MGVKPALVGWIGFGIVSAVRPPAREGVLVLADATCSGVQLSERAA